MNKKLIILATLAVAIGISVMYYLSCKTLSNSVCETMRYAFSGKTGYDGYLAERITEEAFRDIDKKYYLANSNNAIMVFECAPVFCLHNVFLTGKVVISYSLILKDVNNGKQLAGCRNEEMQIYLERIHGKWLIARIQGL